MDQQARAQGGGESVIRPGSCLRIVDRFRKRGIGGTYHAVSTKHLQSYLDEYAFRWNSRGNPVGMFDAILNRIEKASPASPDLA